MDCLSQCLLFARSNKIELELFLVSSLNYLIRSYGGVALNYLLRSYGGVARRKCYHESYRLESLVKHDRLVSYQSGYILCFHM